MSTSSDDTKPRRRGLLNVFVAVLVVLQFNVWHWGMLSSSADYFPLAVVVALIEGAFGGLVIGGLAYAANRIGTNRNARRRYIPGVVAAANTVIFGAAWVWLLSGSSMWGTWSVVPDVLIGLGLPFVTMFFWPPGVLTRDAQSYRGPWHAVVAVIIVLQFHHGMWVLAGRPEPFSVFDLVGGVPFALAVGSYFGLAIGGLAYIANRMGNGRDGPPRWPLTVLIAGSCTLLFEAVWAVYVSHFPTRVAWLVPVDLLIGLALPFTALIWRPPGLRAHGTVRPLQARTRHRPSPSSQ